MAGLLSGNCCSHRAPACTSAFAVYSRGTPYQAYPPFEGILAYLTWQLSYLFCGRSVEVTEHDDSIYKDRVGVDGFQVMLTVPPGGSPSPRVGASVADHDE